MLTVAKPKQRSYRFVAMFSGFLFVVAFAVFIIFIAINLQLHQESSATNVAYPILSDHDMVPDNVHVNVTREEAVNMSLSYIDAYAKENNRVIKNVNVTFSSSVRDVHDSRGNSSLRYPEWAIEAEFYVSENKTQQDITGYIVLIWADTGKIYAAHVQGFY